jgi:tRNA threonylcarbamoyladenosine biosynthesis protein TsaB
MILAIRTDRPEAELLLLDPKGKIADRIIWLADRELSQQILGKIQELIRRNGLTFKDLSGVVVFKGPGSFTGLRIGVSVANAFSYGLGVPVSAAGTADWIKKALPGLQKKAAGKRQIALPEYGAPAGVSRPRK